MSIVMKSGEVPRYNASERVIHWTVAITFILLAASGLAFFHPAFWFLTSLLGGGTWSRILHPFPEIDKYNIGQKQLFWVMVVTMVLLLVSGLVLWRDTVFAFPVLVVRISAVVHAAASFVLILGIIVHMYSAIFWVKGSLRAMTRGTVTHAWARHHHPLWYRRITGNK